MESGALPEELALGVAMLTGIVLIALGLVRAGSMVRFISVETGQWLTDVGEIVTSIPDASAASVAVGVATIVILRLSKRFAPKLPAALIALVVVGGAAYECVRRGEIPSRRFGRRIVVLHHDLEGLLT